MRGQWGWRGEENVNTGFTIVKKISCSAIQHIYICMYLKQVILSCACSLWMYWDDKRKLTCCTCTHWQNGNRTINLSFQQSQFYQGNGASRLDHSAPVSAGSAFSVPTAGVGKFSRLAAAARCPPGQWDLSPYDGLSPAGSCQRSQLLTLSGWACAGQGEKLHLV